MLPYKDTAESAGLHARRSQGRAAQHCHDDVWLGGYVEDG